MTRALYAVNRVYARGYHHVVVHGPNLIPRDGPAMIISNHRSGLDPLLVMAVSPRPIMWMMAKEYFNIRPLRWMFDKMHIIPVSRDGKDSSALRAALRALADGALLGVFPEGKIAVSDDLWPFQTGAAMIAIRGRVPVIPVFHSGIPLDESMTPPFYTPQIIDLYLGKPIEFAGQFAKRKDFEEPTLLLQNAVLALKSPKIAGNS